MSLENVKRFKKDVEENQELKNKIMNELEAQKESGKKEKELIVEIANENGYDFTKEELLQEGAATHELSDEELANVSGGLCNAEAPNGHEVGCLNMWYLNWHAYYVDCGICENCKSTNTTVKNRLSPGKAHLICHDCGYQSPYVTI